MIKSGGNIIVVTTGEYVCSVKGNVSKIRNGTHSPVMYEIFEFYIAYANQLGQKYWEEFFTNASKGFFGNKMYKIIDNRILSAKLGTNNIKTFDLMPASREMFGFHYEKCKEFITNTSGAASKDDVVLHSGINKFEVEPWSGSIQPQRQIAMINIFVEEKAKEHNLSEDTKAELKENLISKIFSGELSTEIKKVGHTIAEIEGLYFWNGRYEIYTKDIKRTESKKKPAPPEEQEDEFFFKCSSRISNSLKRRNANCFI